VVRLTVNGEEQAFDEPLSVDDLIGRLDLDRRGLAVALNGEVVPRSTWSVQPVADGDQVEILTIAQGG
jgi:sulfur carrier protein